MALARQRAAYHGGDRRHHDWYCACDRGDKLMSDKLCNRILELEQALSEFGHHDIGCPGWYRLLPESSRQDISSEMLISRCDCGLDNVLAGYFQIK